MLNKIMPNNESEVAYYVKRSTIFWMATSAFFIGWGTNWKVGIGVFILSLFLVGFLGVANSALFRIFQKLK